MWYMYCLQELDKLTLTAPQRLVVDSPIGRLRLEACQGGLVSLSWTHLPLPTSPGGRALDQAHEFLRQGSDWLRAYFGHHSPPPLPPLALSGTEFQNAVWRQLIAMPPGTRTTYGEIARDLGMPGACRAVGQAVGANPLPILIPCHRVLAAGGKLGGYSSGLRRKRWLLAHEGLAWSG